MPSPDPPNPATYSLLRLSLTPGLGPVLISRALAAFNSADAVLAANEHGLRRIKGIGDDKSRLIASGFADSARLADDELALAAKLNIRILAIHDTDYPALLRQIPDPPPILYIRGTGFPHSPRGESDPYPVAIVGSRACTQYGMEQAERFSQSLAQCGLTIVSGGARGIDTAAHRAALRVNGRTLAVLGCGLADCYPPDNRELFDRIADNHGAIISELPLRTPPNAENFPARNRIISGLSLGVLVIEAGHRSGALITARQAAEDHGREVFALPARVDSSAAQGSLALLKSGGAQLVTHPDDIIQALESPARHHFQGTHEARFAPLFTTPSPPPPAGEMSQAKRVTEGVREATESRGSPDSASSTTPTPSPRPRAPTPSSLSPTQQAILEALDKPRGMDDLARAVNIEPGSLRAEITILEIRKRIARKGTILERIGN